MRKLLLANVAALAMTAAGSALAADMPLKAQTPFAARFTWTGCYLGGQVGGGFAQQGYNRPGAARAGLVSRSRQHGRNHDREHHRQPVP